MENIYIKDSINKAVNILRDADIADAQTDTWLLAEYVFGITREKYFINMQAVVNADDNEKFFEFIQKRAEKIPLQYLTGSQEFMGLPFKVNEHVLIPRQDTELLVETAIKMIAKVTKNPNGWQSKSIRVLDMCTGSGCIAISVAKLCQNVQVTAVDISDNALSVAKENAKLNDVTDQINFIQSDLFGNINERFDVILSNPPYIRTDVVDTLMEEVKEHEPVLALDGSGDGLKFYRIITEKMSDYLVDNGYIIYEIGHDQADDVTTMLRKKASYVKVYKDLAGHDRVVIAGKDEIDV